MWLLYEWCYPKYLLGKNMRDGPSSAAQSNTAADAAFESATQAHRAAQIRFRWWLAGLGYALYCLLGRYLPSDIDSGLLIFLNRHGAAIAALVCAVGALDAFRTERRERRRFRGVAQAWAAGRTHK